MTWNNSNFTEHYKKIKVEGFQLNRLVDQCLKAGIQLRNLRTTRDLEMTLMVSNRDFKRLKKLAKNTYKITILKDGGYKHIAVRIWQHKVTLVGIALFIAFLIYQSLFVAEVRIDGYEKIGERQLRETLAECGIYEGCRKNTDTNQAKIKLYDVYDEISWVGIEFEGRLAKVHIVEGAKQIKTKVEKKKPCNIVADKAGYISKIIPVEGLRAIEDGGYVEKGDILITGTVPLYNMAFGTDTADQTETYVHAEGLVEAKIPIRLNYFAERYQRIKTATGRTIFGISINGHDSAKAMNNFEASAISKKEVLHFVKPFPLTIHLTRVEEVTLSQRETNQKALKKAVEAAIRQYVKENLPEKAQILNKSLNFTAEKNIINIGVTLETLQRIGIEKEIVVDKSKGKTKKANSQ